MIPNSEMLCMKDYVPPLQVHTQLLDHMLFIKALDKASASFYIDQHLPELSEADREWVLARAGQNIRPKADHKAHDPLFCAAMFLAGVSYGDLALLFGVTKQTIYDKVVRRISPAMRKTMRDMPKAVDLEALALARKMFYDAISVTPAIFDDQHPLALGRGLLAAATKLILEDHGSDGLIEAEARPRRYGKLHISTPDTGQIKELVENAMATPDPTHPKIKAPKADKYTLSPLTDTDAPRRIADKDRLLNQGFDEMFLKGDKQDADLRPSDD